MDSLRILESFLEAPNALIDSLPGASEIIGDLFNWPAFNQSYARALLANASARLDHLCDCAELFVCHGDPLLLA
jgi:hypothetical protein